MKPSVITLTLNPALDKTVTLPRLEIGGLNRVREIRLDPGGKGINVAKVLRKFGMDVTAAGLIAGDQGRFIMRQLQREGIAAEFLEVDGETRTNLKIVDEETNITTEINESGFEISPENVSLLKQKLARLLEQASVLVIGGSLPPGVPVDIYRDYIQMANEMGVKTILDADGSAFKAGIEAAPFAVKPNVHELEEWVQQSLSTDEMIVAAGKKLMEKGISIVVISMGSKGSIVLNQTEVYRVLPISITPQSTVGAGDSMVAALVYSILTAKPLEETAKWVTTAGTVTASKPGTQVCTLPEVRESVNRVHALKI